MGKLTRSQQKILGRFIIGFILISLVGTALGYAFIAFLIFIALMSFSEDDCTNLLEVMPEVQAAPDNEVSECIYTILGYA